uniref:U3 small nucleolar RNA-associated protein 18 homolog n=1 Tax=Anopheles culicifacies TaxID=139723 RepID=A0A182M0E6_9DIPT
MESDDDFGQLTNNNVSELQIQKGPKKTVQKKDKSSSNDENASVKSMSDYDDTSIKSEPESQSEDEVDDDEKDAQINSFVRALQAKMGYSGSSEELNKSSDEDDLSVKSEPEDGVSLKSESETNDDANLHGNESDVDKDHTEESMDTTAPTENGAKSLKERKAKDKNLTREEKLQRKMKNAQENLREPPSDMKIEQPRSKKEKELMSLVFGGKAEFVSQLDVQEKKPENVEASKQPEDDEDADKTGEKSKQKRSAKWHDSDDDDEEDSSNIKRNKFARQELPEQLTKERRRKQFEQIVGKPKWADLDRVKEPDSDDEILQKVGHVVKGTPSQGLPKGTIELKKLKNLNRETNAEGSISSINFHPTSMVAIITGIRGLVSIVAVDGVRNEKLHTIWLPKMRIVCSTLSPDGNEAVFGSYRKFYHVYNLISGQSDTRKIPDQETWMMKNFCVSRCGKYLASAGDCGEVHLMSAKSKEVMRTIQLRYTCLSLAFTPDSRYLLCHSNDTEVSVFSLEQKRIVNVFQDEGCVNGTCIAICPNGQYVATGSRQGVVNVYTLDATLTQKNPVPLKTITNLTTYIDSLSFNATSEMLVIASSTVKNAVKLFHIQSGTVFRNFPLHMTNLGRITVAQFSPSGGYLALGTKGSKVLLFRVKHYPNY